MTKNVFKAENIQMLTSSLVITSKDEVQVSDSEVVEVYTGPSVEEMHAMGQKIKDEALQEKETILQEAQAHAAQIIDTAMQDVQKAREASVVENQKLVEETQQEAESIVTNANEQATKIIADAEKTISEQIVEAQKQAYDDTRKEVWDTHNGEVTRLIERLHVMISKVQERRSNMIEESESQIIALVIQIVRKVVKTISENSKNIILENVVQALRRLKTKSNVIIRVNLNDIDIITEHKKELIKNIEDVEGITFVEDIAVDVGGCIVETDFGHIDARMSSQLAEMERRLLEITPMRTSIDKVLYKQDNALSEHNKDIDSLN